MTEDKAGEEYWARVWARRPDPRLVDWQDNSLRNTAIRRYDRMFERYLGTYPASTSLLEVGAAGSRWLPYFVQRFDFSVSGIDYEEDGCNRARHVLELAGVRGEIRHENVFALPDDMIEAFEVVVSFGVIEHFDPVDEIVRACRKSLVPNGLMINVLPNMPGVVGKIQKYLDREVYDAHMLLSVEDVRQAHERAGMVVEECQYFLSLNMAVTNVDTTSWDIRGAVAHGVHLSLKGITACVWALERLVGREFPTSRFWSPSIMCIARNPK